MDDMNDLMTKYLSHSDSPLLAFKNQHQPESLFSPDFDDESGADSYNRTSDSNNDVMFNGHLFCHKKNFNECLNYLNQVIIVPTNCHISSACVNSKNTAL